MNHGCKIRIRIFVMNSSRYWASVAEYGYGFYAMNCCINWTMVADPDYMSWTACRYWNIFAKSGSGFYVMNCWIYNEPGVRIRIRILSQELLYNWTMVADPDFMSWTASCIYIYIMNHWCGSGSDPVDYRL